MVGDEARESLMRGDFLEGIMERAVQGLISQLKAEYQKEMRRALQAARVGDCHEEARPPSILTAAQLLDEIVSPSETTNPIELHKGDPVAEVEVVPETALPNTVTSARSLRVAARSPSACWGQPQQRVSPPCPSNMVLPNAPEPPDADTLTHLPACPRQLTEAEEKALKELRTQEEALKKAAERGFFRNSFRTSMFLDIQGDQPWSRQVALKIAASPYFDFTLGFIIIANALTIGVESSLSRHQSAIPVWLRVCEYIFLVIYCGELYLRVFAVGLRRAFRSNWVKFDALLVASGLLNVLLTILSAQGGAATMMVDNVNMLKMIRLVRLARTVRVLVQFRTLWLLVQGLMYAVMPMLWTSIIMLVVIYVFAVVGMETIVPLAADDEYAQAARNFDTIWVSMTTLLQFMTLDSVAAIYRPLILGTPSLACYFLAFLMLGPIALMNIVTAIMVESSLRTANEDQEAKKAWDNMKRKAMVPKLRDIFHEMDENGDGEVDWEELDRAPVDVKEQIKRIVDLDQLEEIFHLLDYDGSGSIDIDEFTNGIMRSQADKPSELMVLVKQSRDILQRLQRMQKSIPPWAFP